MDLIKRLIAVALILLSTAHAIVSAENSSVQWQTEFGASGTPSLEYWYDLGNLSRNSSGQAFLEVSHSSSMRTSAIRLDASGNSLWSVSNSGSGFTDLAPLHDGSVLTITDVLTLYSPTGEFLWSAYIPTTYQSDSLGIVEVGNEIYANAAGTTVPIYKIDRFTGLVIETLTATLLADPLYSYCGSSAMHSVGESTIYVTGQCGRAVSKVSTNPLRVEWSNSANVSAIAADATGVFVRSRTSTNNSSQVAVQKLATTNGETIWSKDQSISDFVDARLDVDGNLLIRGESTIEKIHGMTGTHLWQHHAEDRIAALDTSSAGIFLSLDTPFYPSILGGKAASIDRNSGNLLWIKPLPPPASFEKSAARGVVVVGDRVIVSGKKCNGPQTNMFCSIALWSMATDGTDLTSPTPMIDLGSKGNATLSTGDMTLAAAIESGPSGVQVSAKKIRNSDGTIIWQSTHGVPLSELPANYYEGVLIQEAGDGDVVLLYVKQPREFTPNSSGVAVIKLDGASGALRWKKSLLDTASIYKDIMTYGVTSDTAGNIFASRCQLKVRELKDLPQEEYSERSIVKLASVTGQQQLRIDFAITTAGHYFCHPPSLRSIGNDLLLEDLPSPSGGYALSRVNGSTGQVVWQTSDVPGYMYLIEANSAYLVNDNTQMTIARMNLDDGALLWTTHYSDPRDATAFFGDILLDSQGGLLVGARRNAVSNSNNPPNRGMLLRLDKSNGNLLWAHRFEQTPNLSINALRPEVERNGIVYSRQYAKASNESVGYFLLANSLATGEFLGAQFFNSASYTQNHLQQDATLNIVGSASDEGLIVAGQHHTPGNPQRFRAAKWNPPLAISGGALKVELSAFASGSQSEARFIFDTINHGTITAHDVLATLSFPGDTVVSNIECDVSGVPCTSQATQGFIEHKLDLPAGQRLRLSGTLKVLDSWLSTTLHANAYGAYGFSEMDLRDNANSLSVKVSLFRNGFD